MASPEIGSFGDVIHSGDLDLITDMLDAESVDLDAGDENYNLETPLMRLCHSELDADDAAAILELMLLKLLDVNKQDSEGRTALCHACMSGQTHFIQRLANARECDPNIADNYGNTALMFGVYYGELPVVQILLQSFAGDGREVDIMQENYEGINAILIANQNGFYEIADLLEQKASVQIENIQNESNVQNDSSKTNTPEQQYVGSKAQNFRRRKLKPMIVGPSLGPLVVSNRLQSSKSADYVQYYKEPSQEKEAVKRQYSYSALTSNKQQGGYDISEKLRYQTEHYEDQYRAEDEDESSSSSGEEEIVHQKTQNRPIHERCTGIAENTLEDDGYEYNTRPPKVTGRRPSISLPDLRRNKLLSRSSLVTTLSSSTGGEDSGYDARSGTFTLIREDLSLPELPEPGSSSNEEDYTPRSRRDSISLPDLRGLRRCLVGTSTTTGKSPRLTTKEIQNAALIDLHHHDIIQDSRGELSDDVFETINLDTSRTNKNGEDKISLTLPNLSENNKTVTPRTVNEPKVLHSHMTKAWGTPRPKNTVRGTTLSELNNKISRRRKILMDRA